MLSPFGMGMGLGFPLEINESGGKKTTTFFNPMVAQFEMAQQAQQWNMAKDLMNMYSGTFGNSRGCSIGWTDSDRNTQKAHKATREAEKRAEEAIKRAEEAERKLKKKKKKAKKKKAQEAKMMAMYGTPPVYSHSAPAYPPLSTGYHSTDIPSKRSSSMPLFSEPPTASSKSDDVTMAILQKLDEISERITALEKTGSRKHVPEGTTTSGSFGLSGLGGLSGS